jgi:hypothetical protein
MIRASTASKEQVGEPSSSNGKWRTYIIRPIFSARLTFLSASQGCRRAGRHIAPVASPRRTRSWRRQASKASWNRGGERGPELPLCLILTKVDNLSIENQCFLRLTEEPPQGAKCTDAFSRPNSCPIPSGTANDSVLERTKEEAKIMLSQKESDILAPSVASICALSLPYIDIPALIVYFENTAEYSSLVLSPPSVTPNSRSWSLSSYCSCKEVASPNVVARSVGVSFHKTSLRR